jgi:small-conductance mechanosensitive channel
VTLVVSGNVSQKRGNFATGGQPSNPFHFSGGRMQVNFSIAWRTAAKIVNDIVSLLPNIILGLLIFALFLVVAAIASSLTRRFVQRRRSHQGMVLLLARLVHTCIVVVGFLIAISVVAPSFQAADLIKLLGIGTVAIGFAFQNILQNFLAGILLLLQEPFQLGDFISVTGIEGNVSDIQARATIVTTTEGRNVFIPNAIIFTNPVAIAHNEPTKPSPG